MLYEVITNNKIIINMKYLFKTSFILIAITFIALQSCEKKGLVEIGENNVQESILNPVKSAELLTREDVRITSYNVCYTKLLRS